MWFFFTSIALATIKEIGYSCSIASTTLPAVIEIKYYSLTSIDLNLQKELYHSVCITLLLI